MTIRTTPGALERRRVVSAAIAALLVVSSLAVLGVGQAQAASAHPVMGQSRVTAAQMAAWFRSKGKTSQATVPIEALTTLFIEEGKDEGVAGDLAFAQSILETGYFTFSSRTPSSFNNFSGLGAVDGGSGAARFSTAQMGVRAQIQHLRAYADATVTSAKLNHPLVDPRFAAVLPKGKAPTWEQFGNGVWASASDYASKLFAIYNQIVVFAGNPQPPTTTTTTTTRPPPPATFAPFETAAAVVMVAYGDILGRTPSSAELDAGVSALNARVTTPSQFIASLVAGEGAQDAQPVARLYLAGLGRLPDRTGLHYWTRRHAAGVPLSELAQQFLISSEFIRRYGSLGNVAYIDVLYRNVLGRGSDANGADYWNRRLMAGQITRSGLIVQFSESTENKAKTSSKVEASVVYVGMVLRAPDPSVLSWWSTKKASGSPLSTLTDLVYQSSAYRARF